MLWNAHLSRDAKGLLGCDPVLAQGQARMQMCMQMFVLFMLPSGCTACDIIVAAGVPAEARSNTSLDGEEAVRLRAGVAAHGSHLDDMACILAWLCCLCHSRPAKQGYKRERAVQYAVVTIEACTFDMWSVRSKAALLHVFKERSMNVNIKCCFMYAFLCTQSCKDKLTIASQDAVGQRPSPFLLFQAVMLQQQANRPEWCQGISNTIVPP